MLIIHQGLDSASVLGQGDCKHIDHSSGASPGGHEALPGMPASVMSMLMVFSTQLLMRRTRSCTLLNLSPPRSHRNVAPTQILGGSRPPWRV